MSAGGGRWRRAGRSGEDGRWWRRSAGEGRRAGGDARGREGGDGGGAERVRRFLGTRGGRALQVVLVAAVCFGLGYMIAVGFLFPSAERPEDRRLVVVPDLVGLDAEAAEESLRGHGLEPEVRARIHHPQAVDGAIVAQSPLPGQLARPGAPIRLTLSAGPESQRIPDLIGMSPRQAVLVLERMGFRVRTEVVTEAAAHDGVQGTRPGAGERVSLPGEVVVLVAEGPQVVVVPSLEGRHVDDVEGLLDEVGLRLGQVRFDPAAGGAPGRVVGQSPPAGYSLRGGGTVSIVVAGDGPGAGRQQPSRRAAESDVAEQTATASRGDG